MAPVQIQTSKPINTSPKLPTTPSSPSQQSFGRLLPTTTDERSPETSMPQDPPISEHLTISARYAPPSPFTSTNLTSSSTQPGASPTFLPTRGSVPPPPPSPTRTVPQDLSRSGTSPPPPQPRAAPNPGYTTADSVSTRPGYSPDSAAPQPASVPPLSHPPGYQQNAVLTTQSYSSVASAANMSTGPGYLSPLARSNVPSPLTSIGSSSHKRNISGAGLLDPGSDSILNGYLPEGTVESAGQYWSAVKEWVGSTASTVGQRAVQVENSVWRRVNGAS